MLMIPRCVSRLKIQCLLHLLWKLPLLKCLLRRLLQRRQPNKEMYLQINKKAEGNFGFFLFLKAFGSFFDETHE